MVCRDGTVVALAAAHKPTLPAEAMRISTAGGYVFKARVNGQLAVSRAFGDLRYKGDAHSPAEQQLVVATPQPRQRLSLRLFFVRERDLFFCRF